MIRRLTGTIVEVGKQWVVVEVGHVGYLINCTATTDSFHEGETVVFHTYLSVRENALDLYGFTGSTELAMFELLLGVPKIGPKSALQIMSQATPTLLVESAQKNDALYLHKLSGIGKKTAENIVQYLSSKTESLPNIAVTTASTLTTTQTDAIDTLVALGYDLTSAREAVLSQECEDTTVNALVTKALREIL